MIAIAFLCGFFFAALLFYRSNPNGYQCVTMKQLGIPEHKPTVRSVQTFKKSPS